MLDINLIKNNPEKIKSGLLKKGTDVNFDNLLKMDTARRELQAKNDALKAEKNAASADIAKLKKSGQDATKQVAKMQEFGVSISKNDVTLAKLEEDIFTFLSALPNMPDDDVVAGGKEYNKVVKTFGAKPSNKVINHYDTCVSLGMIDFERAAKISGAGTWIYRDKGAILEWALLNYFVDFHVKNGYEFILPPHLLNYQSGFSAGQFPKFEDDVFWTDFDKDRKQSKFLLPTAETALINLYRNEIVSASELPKKLAGYTPCYRREAGNRAEERGTVRGYQFNKIEMFIFCSPQDSPKFFNELVNNAEKLVEGLGLHYQTVALAAGDCTSAMAKTYDIEVYIPSMNGYKEVSSVSNARDYQARRAGIKMRNADGKTEFLHTLNASGLATSRLVPAICEQFQNPDGSVNIPKALWPWTFGITKITKK